MRGLRTIWWLAVLCVAAGCATYAHRIREPRYLLETGKYDAAIEKLKKLAEAEDNDQLLYFMDLGLAYHRAGRFKEATQAFLKADQLAEIKDYTSLSTEAATVLLNDDVKAYKGEDFEKILINVYLAIDFTLAGEWESALVECRKVNHKLDLMIREGKLPYERNAFAKYLAGVLFEARGEWNDAFVDYRQLLKWRDDLPYLGVPLLRMAASLQAEQELAQYRKKFPKEKNYRLDGKTGEVVLLVEQGKVPIKVPHPNFRLLPKFQKRVYTSDYVVLRDKSAKKEAPSHPFFDIEATAIKELDNRIAGMAAKKVGGVVVKEIVAHQVAKHTESEALGALTSFLLQATDHADLRSWSTLPARLHIARLTLPAGRRDLVLDMVSRTGNRTRAVHVWPSLEVKPGKIHFLHYRTQD